MLHTAAPPSTCKELLQDSQPMPARTCRTGSQHVPADSPAAGQLEKPAGQREQDCGQRRSSRGIASSFSSNSGSGLSGKAATPGQLPSSGESPSGMLPHASIGSATAAGASPSVAADEASSGKKKKAGRVEDDPGFFRTPKDPPTLQRFAQSLAQMSLSSSSGGGLSTVQRHEAGIKARQQAQVVAAAQEVAALDAGSQPDID